MSTEAQKVIPRDVKTPGAPEVSASIARAVDSILDILRGVPPAYRLQVLRIAESKIRPSIVENDEIVRKVIRVSRSFYIRAPSKYSYYAGTYKLFVVNGKAIYERTEEDSDVKVRHEAYGLRIPFPKWVYEQLGSPSYVKLRFEANRIIVEPA